MKVWLVNYLTKKLLLCFTYYFSPKTSLRKKYWIFFGGLCPYFSYNGDYVLWGNIGRILSSMLNTMNKRRYKYLHRRPDCKYLIPSGGWKEVLQVSLNHPKSLLYKNTFSSNKKCAHKNAKRTNIGTITVADRECLKRWLIYFMDFLCEWHIISTWFAY